MFHTAVFEGPVPTGAETLIPGDRGRKHLAHAPSAEITWRPMRRTLDIAASADDTTKATGKRAIQPNKSSEFQRAEQRHNIPAYMRSGYDSDEPRQWDSRRVVEWPGKAKNAREFISSERVLEVECGMKARVPSTREMRNGIPMKTPGDKMYGYVDYSKDFWKQEGLIVGSSISSKRTPKIMTSVQTSALDTSDGVNFRPQPSYEAKKRASIHNEEVNSVSSLPLL